MANPKLRFKSAINDNIGWRQVRLNELGVFISGQTYNRSCVTNNESDVLIIRSSNLQDLEYVDVCNDLQFVSIDIPSEKYLKKNDVVICTANGSTNLVGKASIYDGSYHGLISWGAFCSVFRSNNVLAKFFFRTPKYRTLIHAHKQGGNGSLGNLNVSAISSEEIFFPESANEQHKIAEFFTALDEKIRLESQKLTRFHELKKKLLVNVFSFEDYCETGFFDVVQSLMDYRGKTPLKLGMSWSDVETPYLALSALNVKDQGIDHSKEAHYGTKVLYKKWMKDKPLRPKQILMTTEAPAGVVMQVPDDRPYILSQRVIALDVDPAQVDECFFAYLLRSPFVQKQIERLCSGGTAKGISQKHLRELKVRYPKSIKTQQRIADLFCNIDSRISICAKKLESLEKLKKAFMQRMFV